MFGWQERWRLGGAIMQVPKPQSDSVYRSELLDVIQSKIDEHPRSHQVEIGPSEAGGCPRKTAYKMAYGGDSERQGGWAAHKGSLVHLFLDEAFKGTDRFMPDGSQRFYSDLKLDRVTPHVNGGTLDLYDRLNQVVVDAKAPGEFTMKSVRNGEPKEGYFVQIQMYALGLERMGYPISKCALLWLPMCGNELHGMARGAVLQVWPYDRQVALDAIARIERIKNMLDVAPARKVLEVMEIKSDFCADCPCFIGSGDRRAFCPGVSTKPIKQASDNPFS
jgi:hypothetical protein